MVKVESVDMQTAVARIAVRELLGVTLIGLPKYQSCRASSNLKNVIEPDRKWWLESRPRDCRGMIVEY